MFTVLIEHSPTFLDSVNESRAGRMQGCLFVEMFLLLIIAETKTQTRPANLENWRRFHAHQAHIMARHFRSVPLNFKQN